jgi:hypothetical protein
MAVFINPRDAKRSFSGDKLLVNAHRVAMDVIAFLKELARNLEKADSVPDLKSFPERLFA